MSSEFVSAKPQIYVLGTIDISQSGREEKEEGEVILLDEDGKWGVYDGQDRVVIRYQDGSISNEKSPELRSYFERLGIKEIRSGTDIKSFQDYVVGIRGAQKASETSNVVQMRESLEIALTAGKKVSLEKSKIDPLRHLLDGLLELLIAENDIEKIKDLTKYFENNDGEFDLKLKDLLKKISQIAKNQVFSRIIFQISSKSEAVRDLKFLEKVFQLVGDPVSEVKEEAKRVFEVCRENAWEVAREGDILLMEEYLRKTKLLARVLKINFSREAKRIERLGYIRENEKLSEEIIGFIIDLGLHADREGELLGYESERLKYIGFETTESLLEKSSEELWGKIKFSPDALESREHKILFIRLAILQIKENSERLGLDPKYFIGEIQKELAMLDSSQLIIFNGQLNSPHTVGKSLDDNITEPPDPRKEGAIYL